MTEPSADLLRRAASEMRAKAEAATEGPWKCVPDDAPTTYVYPEGRVLSTAPGMDDQDPSIADMLMHCDAQHIASWHPVVALGVADLLDRAADAWIPDPHGERETCCCCAHQREAVDIARAYLGESA